MQNRRTFLSTLATGFCSTGLSVPAFAHSYDVLPHDAGALQTALDRASDTGQPVFLGAGDYYISAIQLPKRVNLIGVSGATRLYGTGGHLWCEGGESFHIAGISLVGDQLDKRPLLRLVDIVDISIKDCIFSNSGGSAVELVRCGGELNNSTLKTLSGSGIFALDCSQLRIQNNEISNCGNGGVLVHRTQAGFDGAMISGNRIERIRADNGGTGQWGNGINVFRTGDVMISGNYVSDCDYSTIRANAAENLQIVGNQCHRAGETSVYSEFASLGSLIANNVIDGGTIGVSVPNFDSGGRLAVVSGNLIRNLNDDLPYVLKTGQEQGIGIYVEADASVSGNVIENAKRFGMQIGWGSFGRNVVADGNLVRRTRWGVGVSIVNGVKGISVTDNHFSDITEQAISGFRWAETDGLELLGSDGIEGILKLSGNQLN